MGTRCGDIDPAIVPYVMKKTGMSPDEMDTALNKKSGMLGVSGISSDARDIEDAVAAGKSEKEVSNLLNNYLDALEKQGDIESKAAEKYAKVLPMEKVAKLYVGEEKFRRQQIRRLHPNPMQR